jgi:glycosyltransferase involved in cell wall biosynthesis
VNARAEPAGGTRWSARSRPDLPTPRSAATPPWVIVSAAFVTTGGQDRANLALASYLARRGEQVHLIAHRIDLELAAQPSLTYHHAPRPFRSDLLGEPFLRRLGRRSARGLSAHVPRVVVNGGNCDWPDVNWVHYVHAAHDRTVEGGWLRRARLRLSHRKWVTDERRALLHARLVIANSQRTMGDLIQHVGVPASRIRVIYYGIDPEHFRPPLPGERDATRARLGWASTRPIVLFIGALGDRRKGFATLFDAWVILSRRKAVDPLLVVIGRGAQLAEWQQRVAETGMGESVCFLGFRDDVPSIMRAADALVSPTRYEAYGLGVHEALCCGLPAIVSAKAGVAERYPAELSGLLLPDVRDANDLAHHVERCIDGSTYLPGALGALAARMRLRSWDDMSGDIVAAACEP